MNSNSLLLIIALTFIFSVSPGCRNNNRQLAEESAIQLPDRGLCAHRGAMATHPENTLPAFQAAIEAGAHMIEFDVQLTKDNELVVMHDLSVDRTTDGSGLVAGLTLPEIRQLDAGSWKSPEFKGERVPTLDEVLEIMPVNIWLNIHIKGEDKAGALVAEKVREHNRLHQAFIACGAGAAAKAREVVPTIMICNMDRRQANMDYVTETIEMDAAFIQLRGEIYPAFADYVRLLRDNGVRINYFGTDDADEIKLLFDYGVDFPLVDDILSSIHVVAELGIQPVKAQLPDFR